MKPAASKSPAGGMETTQSGKQEGLSNTDTKHSTDIANNPEKSKKGEGAPETAKLKGTIVGLGTLLPFSEYSLSFY